METRTRRRGGPQNVFVIDDFPPFGAFVRRGLQGARLNVSIFLDGASGLSAAAISRPDLIILDLDLGMPGHDGFQVLRALRMNSEFSDVPVIVVTGLPDSHQILKSAADASRANCLLYKPLSLRELRFAVAKLIRNLETPRISYPLVATKGNLRVDIIHKTVHFGGEKILLRSLNSLLILAILAQAVEAVPREILLKEVWSEGENLSSVDTAIHRLNADLAKRKLPFIVTGTGHGYLLAERAQPYNS